MFFIVTSMNITMIIASSMSLYKGNLGISVVYAVGGIMSIFITFFLYKNRLALAFASEGEEISDEKRSFKDSLDCGDCIDPSLVDCCDILPGKIPDCVDCHLPDCDCGGLDCDCSCI